MINNRVTQVSATACFTFMLLSSGLWLYWMVDRFTPHTALENPRVVGSNVAHPSEIVKVEYVIWRKHSCTLEISRLLEREQDRREFLVQLVTQSIERDYPLFPRPSGYQIKIPQEMIPGQYLLFSRVRYYCNPMDWIWPHFARMPSVSLTIVN